MIFENYMNKAFLLTGGNMGEREENLLAAIEHINQHCGLITNSSSLYETAVH